MKKFVLITVAAVLCITACSQGQTTGEIKLGVPYIDPVKGFSLRPPLGTTCSRIASANRLVMWTMRKSPKAPILWRLSVYSRIDEQHKPGENLAAYGKKLGARLAKAEGFKAPAPRIIELPGAKAINLRGETSGKIKFWQRRAWIHLQSRTFLEVRISGPTSDREKLDAIASAVLKTLKIIDLKTAKAQRKTALVNGTALLKGLNAKKISGTLEAKPQWFLYHRDGQPIGFMRQIESTEAVAGKPGYRIKSCIMMKFDGKNLKLYRDLLASADRSVEKWTETAGIKASGRNVSMVEKGSKSDARIDCSITVGSKKTTQKPVDAPMDHYLPRGMAWLLSRLVDLKTPASYGFATYNGRAGNFDLRTFTVAGPAEIELAGHKVNAIAVTDQLTANTQTANMWVDTRGNLLIMKTADGLVMERASQKSVERRFPNALETIKSMGK
ncbi:MAG: hypothetical protein HN350_06650 [Phycisphaerales bacterium]|jgi:hypothetical protein|nr:hypothetical protein [Phycisphaerales bacterium]